MNPIAPPPWTVSEILAATGGELLGGPATSRFAAIGIDSRRLQPSDFFIAIKGDTHDGHSFAAAVVAAGGRGLLLAAESARKLPWPQWAAAGVTCIAVADTTRALGDLGAFQRRRLNVPVVAITGSNGKTTTRGMTAEVVSRRFHTLATIGNFNNQIGLPLTLLRLTAAHQWAVLEMGMNHPGEIRRLAALCNPRIGVITNVAAAHLAGLGSLEAVKRAKGELLAELAADGTAVLNADDPRVMELAAETRQRVVRFATAAAAEVQGRNLQPAALGTTFDLVLPGARATVTLAVPGRFMVANALAAAAVGWTLGVDIAEIKAGLEAFRPITGRMVHRELTGGIHLIDDTYNANPGSMAAAIQTLADLGRNARRMLVMGDMLELGEQSAALHAASGELAARSEPFRLLVAGRFREAVARGARAGGLPRDRIFEGGRDEILAALKKSLRPGDWVLVKGSRGMGMETIVQGLMAWAGP